MSNQQTKKRPASSPLQDEADKRSCLTEDSMIGDDNDDTIVTDFLSSTLLEGGSGSAASQTAHPKSTPQMEELKAVLGDPHILDMISKAVAAQVLDPLRREIQGLRATIGNLQAAIESKDRQIMKLQDRVDELEQYWRRNSLRITSVPEVRGESTDDVVRKIFKEVDVEVTEEMIDRSHRVGRKQSEGDTRIRPILLKCTSYRHKAVLMAARKKLPAVDVGKLFPGTNWPSLTRSSSSAGSRAGGAGAAAAAVTPPRIFINHDLTKERSEIAWMARNLKRKRKIEDTWVTDGVIFVKQNDVTYRVTTKREMTVFDRDM